MLYDLLSNKSPRQIEVVECGVDAGRRLLEMLLPRDGFTAHINTQCWLAVADLIIRPTQHVGICHTPTGVDYYVYN